MKTYENFNELKQEHESLAIEILDLKGKGEWVDEEIYLHESKIDFAEHEVYYGWYSSILGIDKDKVDFNHAPNLFDYIDYKSLSDDLICTWDESVHYFSEIENKVVSTGNGW